MLWIAVRVAVFLIAAGLTALAITVGLVLAAGEVSCYEVCSPTTEWIDNAQPWPFIATVVVSLGVGWLASLLVHALDRSRD